jgi:hypothetical protein
MRDQAFIEERTELVASFLGVLDQLVEAKEHVIDHSFEDAWWVGRERGKVEVEVQCLSVEGVVDASIVDGKGYTEKVGL